MDLQTVAKTDLAIILLVGSLQIAIAATIIWLIWRFVSAHEKIANAMYTIALHTGRSDSARK